MHPAVLHDAKVRHGRPILGGVGHPACVRAVFLAGAGPVVSHLFKPQRKPPCLISWTDALDERKKSPKGQPSCLLTCSRKARPDLQSHFRFGCSREDISIFGSDAPERTPKYFHRLVGDERVEFRIVDLITCHKHTHTHTQIKVPDSVFQCSRFLMTANLCIKSTPVQNVSIS